MWTETLLKKFKLKTAGEDDSGNQDDSENNNDDDQNLDDSGDDQDDSSDGDDDSEGELSAEDYQKQIKKLRAENAKHRSRNKALGEKMGKFEKAFKAFNGDDDDENPEQKLDAVTQNYESAVTRNAVLELALENGISGREHLEYFEFLMGRALDSLEEDEELSEEALEEILAKCSKQGGTSKANTSTSGKGKGNRSPGSGKDDQVSQEEFDKMGIMAKSKLYQKNPELYNTLMANSSVR